MFSKLTANLKKSEQYGKKIIEELSTISNQINKNKIQISSIQRKIEEAVRDNEKLTTTLKRQSQQFSNYEYKLQKLEIRKKEYSRKLNLQQQMHNKKLIHRDSLLKKIEQLEKQMKSECQSDKQGQKLKNQIEEINMKINRQSIEIENLFHQLMNKNKQLRIKQDELQWRRKMTKKNKDHLSLLQNNLKSSENKQNVCTNMERESSSVKMQNLAEKKAQTDFILMQNMDALLAMCEEFEHLSEGNVAIKKQTSKDWEIFQQIKCQKNIIAKLRDGIKLPF